MSWSRSIHGSPSAVKDDAAQWKTQQKEYDRNVDAPTQSGYAAQIDAAVIAVNAIADAAPTNCVLEGSVWGHASFTGATTFGISLKY